MTLTHARNIHSRSLHLLSPYLSISSPLRPVRVQRTDNTCQFSVVLLYPASPPSLRPFLLVCGCLHRYQRSFLNKSGLLIAVPRQKLQRNHHLHPLFHPLSPSLFSFFFAPSRDKRKVALCKRCCRGKGQQGQRRRERRGKVERKGERKEGKMCSGCGCAW